jgi:hypothetical protein
MRALAAPRFIPHAEALIQRWVATAVMANPKVQRELQDFFPRHG